MARMTISVPDDLYKRVRRADGENWSAVAAAAFESKLEEISKRMRDAKVQELAESLKTRTIRLPKGAQLDAIKEQRQEFIERITYQAEWRDQKAAEYPDDSRNERSAKSLRQLAEQLDMLPPNDSLWARYHNVWELADDITTLTEHEHETLRTYGFHNGEIAEVTAQEATDFLRELVEELERLAAETMVED